MKQHAKEKTVPPPRKDDRMTGKESFLSALLGVAINVMAMVFAGVFWQSSFRALIRFWIRCNWP